MQNKMFRKGLIIVIILIFLGSTVVPSTATLKKKEYIKLISSGDILFVGGTGPGNYSTIQEAINAANIGDTIFVYKGQYSRFTANKKLTIIGENRTDTIVYANENKLAAEGINLSGFTFKGKELSLDCVLNVNNNNIFISDCTFYPTDGIKPLYGIDARNCGYVTITNCDVLGFNYRGIQCLFGHHFTIEDCKITGSYIGIDLYSPHINIKNCEIAHCGWDDAIPGAGIRCEEDYNNIYNCSFYNNMRGVKIKCSSHNEVKDCEFQNNNIGCLLENPYYGNGRRTEDVIISLNNFLSNDIGLKIDVDCYYNSIYHNNFIGTSTYQAYDTANNIWDDGYPSGGNYWFDYTGEDNNGDGIGDTPYSIPGGGNQDNYPFMEPLNGINRPPNAPTITGPTNGKVNIEYEYTFNAIDLDGDDISYYVDWGDDTNTEWTEYVPSGTTVTLNHTWTKIGTYDVRAKAKDINGAESSWGYHHVIMPFNYNQNSQKSVNSQQILQILKNSLSYSCYFNIQRSVYILNLQ